MTVLSKPASGKSVTPKKNYVAPVPLVRHDKKETPKEDLLEFELRSTPQDPNSSKFKTKVAIYETGTPEEVLEFLKKVRGVIFGLHITQGPPMYTQMRQLLCGDALAAFNTAATNAGNETVLNFTTACNGLCTHVFPQRGLAKQKRVMRRYMHKPVDWTMSAYVTRMIAINELLKVFPPFGGNAQALPDEELLDIFEYASPQRWQRQMTLQGYDPIQGSIDDMVRFCERMEAAEEDDVKPKAKPSSKNGSQGKADNNQFHYW